MLRDRARSAAILVPPLLVALWLGGGWILLVVGAATALGAWEAFRLLTAAGHSSMPALGIVLQLTWHFQLEEAAKHASPLWRETGGRGLPRCLQSPDGNALLIEICILQMADPGEEADMSLDEHAEALGGIGPIGCDVRPELWHQARVIEHLFLVLAEVGLGTAHPEDVAVENDLAVIE